MRQYKLKQMKADDLLKLYAELMEELRKQELIRTSNNPVADYAEKVAVAKLKLNRASKEERGYDATDTKGRKYQIKGRRTTRHNRSRQLGVIRNLDQKLFNYLVAVIFNEQFEIEEIWKIPHAFVKKHGRWSDHQNGYIFHAKPNILSSYKHVQRSLLRKG